MTSHERRVVFNSVIGSLVIAILVFILLISFAPDTNPYSLSNYGSNGLHSVGAQYSIHEISALSDAPISNRTVLLIVAPISNFSSTSAVFLKQFVQYGGTLVIADSYGFSNSLLSQMGLGVQIQNQVIVDPTYNWQSENYPVALVNTGFSKNFPFIFNVSGIALTRPRPLLITSPLVSVIAVSSSQSVGVSSTQSLPINGSSISGQSGPFPLVAAETIGRGTVVVAGDSSFLTNSVWTGADNRVLINNLLSNSQVYLDTSHWPQNTATALNANFKLVYNQLSIVPFRYLFVLGSVGAAVLLTPMLTDPFYVRKRAVESPVSTLNNETLNRVRRDREKYGIQHE